MKEEEESPEENEEKVEACFKQRKFPVRALMLCLNLGSVSFKVRIFRIFTEINQQEELLYILAVHRE